MSASVILKLGCDGDIHRLKVHRNGDIELLDHNEKTLRSFAAFDATPPPCLAAMDEWRKAQPDYAARARLLGEEPDYISQPRAYRHLIAFLLLFLSEHRIQLIAADWCAHLLPVYKRLQRRGKLATLPRRFITAIRKELRHPRPVQQAKKQLAPIQAEMLKALRYVGDRRWEVDHGTDEYYQRTHISNILDAIHNCYYLVVPLGVWVSGPLGEDLEAVATVGRVAAPAVPAPTGHEIDDSRERQWQAWHAAKVVAAIQQGKPWPRVA